MTVDDLRQQIEETERLIAVYRNADEVIVGTQDQIYSRGRSGTFSGAATWRRRATTRSICIRMCLSASSPSAT